MKKAGYFTLAIPFLALLYMIAANELSLKKFREYRVEVTGYDPVHILTGHYLTFRYKWPADAKNNCMFGQECFACFGGEAITFETAKNTGSCKAALILDNGQPDHNLREYNVPETEAPVLDRMLRDGDVKFEIGLIVYPDHNGQIKTLYLNGKTISDFAK